MARTVGLKVKKAKKQNQTPPQTPPAQTADGANNDESKE